MLCFDEYMLDRNIYNTPPIGLIKQTKIEDWKEYIFFTGSQKNEIFMEKFLEYQKVSKITYIYP